MVNKMVSENPLRRLGDEHVSPGGEFYLTRVIC